MNVNKGRYSLVKRSTLDGEKEIFDFSKEMLDFTEEEYQEGINSVSLATIDSLTTAFDGPIEFIGYLNKERIPQEEFSSTITIDYKSQTGEEKSLCAVWQDDTLHKIASAANGGKVNLNDPTTNEVFHDMFYRLRNYENGFADSVFNSKSNDTKVNDHNVKLIRASMSGVLDTALYQRLAESFSNYREFRSLYVAYKRNIEQQEKKDPKKL